MERRTGKLDKTPRQNRVREALGRIYDHHPPYFREYLRRFREDPTSRVFAPLAEAYRRLGRVDEAIEICREGLEHHPDFQGGRVALAKCYLDKKMFADARVELERVVQFVPENLLAQRLLGDVYLQLGLRPAALHCLKMALLLSPTDVTLAEKVHQLEKEIETGISRPPREEEDKFGAATPQGDENFNVNEFGLEESTLTSIRELPEDEGEILQGLPDLGASADGELPPLWDVPAARSEPDPITEEPKRALPPEIESLLASDDPETEDEPFKIEHVSSIFFEPQPKKKEGITTETLGDLYYSQGQFDRSLRIFEKLHEVEPSIELQKKIRLCRMKLGVDRQALVRNRQIQVLKGLLQRLQSHASTAR